MILYKYYNFSAGIEALKSRKLGFRNPAFFNDPFELSYLYNVNDLKCIPNTTEPLKKSLVILSLTRTPFNPLMWAHYGDEHKGFVIGYDIEDEFFLSREYNLISANEGDVIYTPTKEKIDISDDLREILNNIFNIGNGEAMSSFPTEKLEEIAPILKKILLYKHSCWAYEEEVRVIKVLDSGFDESHVWQSDPYRAFSSLDKMVAPGKSTNKVPGLYLYEKEAKIREVYLGMRNPLLNRQPNVQIKNRDVYELAKDLAWSVNKMSMSNSSWGLESIVIDNDLLKIPEQTKGLINSFSFSGHEAEYLSKELPQHLNSAEDQYELTNWSGEINLKKNGEFTNK